MNLNHLRVFAAVAAQGSLTGASKFLKISQPAVSVQLAELESALGSVLVHRHARGAGLTEAGEALARHARLIFQAEAAAEAELREMRGRERGRLAVGASTTIGSYLVPDLFARFQRLHPKVELRLEIGNTAAIQEAVRDGSLDLGLTEGFADASDLEAEVFAHDEMVMIVAPDSALARRKEMTIHELQDVPLLMREHGSGSRDVVEAALKLRNAKTTELMSLGSTEAVKNAVAAGLGASIVSRLSVELELDAGVLSEVTVKELQIHRALHLLLLKNKAHSPAVNAFVGLLRDSASEKDEKS